MWDTISTGGSFTFPITVPEGGTGLTTLTNHGILVGEGTANVNSITLSTGQLLIGSTGNDPVAATLTAGSNITITNAPGSITIASTGGVSFPITVPQGGTGLTTLTAHGIIIGEGVANVNPIVLTNGELLIGATGLDPVATTLTAGSGITITNASGSITIASTGGVSFPITVPEGGTGLTSPTPNGILIGEGTANVNPIVLSTGQLLIGSTGVDPVAATLTAGSGVTITNAPGSITIASTGGVTFPITAAEGGTGLTSLTTHGILVGEGVANVNPIVLSNGQLLIGSTGADPIAASLTAGANIAITPGAGSITINATGIPSLPLSVANGGTGLFSLTAHGILVGEGVANVNPITLTNGELLIGSTGADPVATTLTAGSGITVTNAPGSITIASTGGVTFPITVPQGGTGLTTLTTHGILVGEGVSNVNPIVLTNGQLLIGSTGVDPVAATLTAGTGITIGNSPGAITITATGTAALPWTTEGDMLYLHTGVPARLPVGTVNQVLKSDGTDPFWTSYLLDDGVSNVSLGTGSLPTTSTGSNNSSFGFSSLNSNSSGSDNCSFGAQSLFCKRKWVTKLLIRIRSVSRKLI